jgi:hypothetical protein
MITITILNAKEAARRQGGGRAAATGHMKGGVIERQVRDNMAKEIGKQLASRGIEAEVDTSGSRKLEIDITNPAEAAWMQGYFAWAIAKVMPSIVDQRLASGLRDQLEEQRIDADVEVE